MVSSSEERVLAGVAPDQVERIAIGAIQIPSFGYPPGSEQALAEFFIGELKSIGCEVELQEVTSSRPNVIARLKGSGSGRKVLFNGHMDTTPGVLGWTRDPIRGDREGDLLYGQGVSNMKASCAAMIGAVAALANSGVNFPGEVILSLVMGECTGGTGTKALVERGIEADYFINGEPTDLKVLTLSSGVCRVQIKVSGRAAHAGASSNGIHAIEKMMKILQQLGPSQLPIDWVKKRVDKPEYDGFPRYNLGVIRGGLTKEFSEWGAYNTPDYCVATLDVRFTPGLTPDLVKEDLETKLKEIVRMDPDIHAEVELMLEWSMLPYESHVGDYMVDTMMGAAQSVKNVHPEAGALARLKFMAADAGSLQSAGIPGVMFGVGTFVSSVPDEFVEVSKVIDLTKMYALAGYRVAATRLD